MIEGKDFGKLESLEELKWAIDIGLDIEFYLYGVRYNISTNETPFIAVCPDGGGKYYKDAKDMIENHKIQNRPLKDIWMDFEILAM